MAAVNVTISGVLCDKLGRTIMPCTIVGEASFTDLGVGGGPIMPPDAGQPPGIWGPNDPRPTPPIQLPPGVGSGNPPGIWGGGNVPMPTPPIHLPPVPPPSVWPPGPGIDFPSHPIVLPPGIDTIPPGPIDWKVAWTPDTGWVVVGVPNVPHPVPSGAPTPAAPKK